MIPTNLHGKIERLDFPQRAEYLISLLVKICRQTALKCDAKINGGTGNYSFWFPNKPDDVSSRDLESDLELTAFLDHTILLYRTNNPQAFRVVDKIYELLGEDMARNYEYSVKVIDSTRTIDKDNISLLLWEMGVE